MTAVAVELTSRPAGMPAAADVLAVDGAGLAIGASSPLTGVFSS